MNTTQHHVQFFEENHKILNGDRAMSDHQALREQYSGFFKKVYAHGTATRGILDASRPNTSEKWNSAGDIERSEEYANEYAQESLGAIDLLLGRHK